MKSILNKTKDKKKQIKKILIYAPNWVGDHAMAFPFYFTAKRLFPHAKLYLIGRSWVSSLFPVRVFDRVIPILGGKSLDKKSLEGLSKLDFDISFTLSPSFRSARLLKKIGAKYRVGYTGQMRSMYLRYPPARGAKRIPPYNIYEHRSLSYLRLLTPWFADNQIAEDYFEDEKYRKYQRKDFPKSKNSLKKNILEKTRNSLVICPGSVAESKIWPIEYIRSLICMIFEKKMKKKFLFDNIILVGSKIEQTFAKEIYGNLPKSISKKVFDITCQTDLPALWEVINNADCVLANDSGVSHIASLTKTALVSFQGMGRKEETSPLAINKVIHHRHLECSPCMSKVCKNKKNFLGCLREISPEIVFRSMVRLLNHNKIEKLLK